jgi:hypothetical protein
MRKSSPSPAPAAKITVAGILTSYYNKIMSKERGNFYER